MKISWKTVVGLAGTVLELIRKARKEVHPGCAKCEFPNAIRVHDHIPEEERKVEMRSWLNEVKREFPAVNEKIMDASKQIELMLQDQPWFIQCIPESATGTIIVELRAVNGGIKKMIPAEFEGFPTKIHVHREKKNNADQN